MVLALAAIQRGDQRRLRIWLLATAFFGLLFVGGQVFEFTEFYREGLSLSSNLFGTTFFTLTGLHGAHVTVGIIWLLTLWGRSVQGKLEPGKHEAIEIAGCTGTSSTWCGSSSSPPSTSSRPTAESRGSSRHD